MRNIINVLLVSSLLSVGAANAQNSSERYQIDHQKRGLTVGLNVGTLGFGPSVALPINDHFTFRGAVTFMKSKIDNDNDIDITAPKEIYEKKGYNPIARTKLDLSMINGQAIISYSPVKNGFFHLNAGLVLGKTKIKMDGALVNPKDGSPYLTKAEEDHFYPNGQNDKIKYMIDDEFYLSPDKQVFDSELSLGNAVKPYLGFTLGRLIPKGRVSLLFDLGVLYSGDLSLKSAQFKSNSGKEIIEYLKDHKDYKEYLEYAKWYPVLNLTLSVRL